MTEFQLEQSGFKLNFKRGRITLIIGANGSGKTYLLEQLTGMRSNPQTHITIDGQLLYDAKKGKVIESALQLVNYMPQFAEDQLYETTLERELHNVLRAAGIKPSSVDGQTAIVAALDAVGWDASWLQRAPLAMSGGERRRAALACLIVHPAPWLVLDEPSAGLDAAGHAQLAELLCTLARAGHGVVVVSHDHDWALPLADDVVLVTREAQPLYKQVTQAQLLEHPEWFKDIGIHVPEYVQWLHQRVFDPVTKAEQSNRVSRALSAQPLPKVASLDARLLMVAYFILSWCILQQQSWTGLGIAALLVWTILTAGQVRITPYLGVVRVYAIFALLRVVTVAWPIHLGDFTLDVALAESTAFVMVRPIVALVLSFALIVSMHPQSMREALERMLSWKGAVYRWAQPMILIIVLMFRFIPHIVQQWHDYSAYRMIRRKQTGYTFVKMIPQLLDTLIPFMLSLFRLADQTVIALETRGVGKRPYPQVSDAVRALRWRKAEWIALGVALVCGTFLIVI